MGRLVIRPWDRDARCHTHGCYGRVAWKVVPDDLQDVTSAIVAGICDDCKATLTAAATQEIPPIGWPEVDKFLREHRSDPLAKQLVEGAMNMPVGESEPKATVRRGRQATARQDT